RHAWCCLRDAGERAGMRRVLTNRPWGEHARALGGGKLAADSEVLKLMSFAAQHFLRELLNELKVIAWQRRGGLSADLLEGVETRLRDPGAQGSPGEELRRRLVPKLPPVEELPRELLEEEEEAHRRECEEREERWDSELAETLTTAEEVRKRLIRRGTKKLPPGSFKWWEDMETRAKSGWLSKQQLAASEFARRVAIKHGIGVVAALMKKKELDAVGAAGADASAAAASSAAVPASGKAPDRMDVSRQRKAGGGGGGSGDGSRSVRPTDGGGTKRPLDPLADDNEPLQTVRSIRRRLVLGPLGDGDGDGDGDGGDGGGGGAQEGTLEADGKGAAARVEINNADLAELLRSTKPKGDPRKWARIFYRAQNSRQGTHAGGGR
ncbi:unnamed protein product, partial [Hapterophycus canaliculatus]